MLYKLTNKVFFPFSHFLLFLQSESLSNIDLHFIRFLTILAKLVLIFFIQVLNNINQSHIVLLNLQFSSFEPIRQLTLIIKFISPRSQLLHQLQYRRISLYFQIYIALTKIITTHLFFPILLHLIQIYSLFNLVPARFIQRCQIQPSQHPQRIEITILHILGLVFLQFSQIILTDRQLSYKPYLDPFLIYHIVLQLLITLFLIVLTILIIIKPNITVLKRIFIIDFPLFDRILFVLIHLFQLFFLALLQSSFLFQLFIIQLSLLHSLLHIIFLLILFALFILLPQLLDRQLPLDIMSFLTTVLHHFDPVDKVVRNGFF